MGQSMGGMVARGGSILAACLLVLLGVYHFFSGIAAFVRGNFYTIGANYPYATSNNTWGWVHVIVGVLLAITGLALFGRSPWARWVAIGLASASVIINFFFLPFFPLWAIVMIPLAIFAIWAIARDSSEMRQREVMGQRSMAGAFGGQGGGQQQQQPGLGTQQPERQPVGAGSTYAGAQSGQRWPENREQQQGQGQGQGQQQGQPQAAQGERRNWSPSDIKENAGRTQEQMQAGAQQQGRNAAEEAADRARQSSNRDYRSGR